MKVKAYAAHQSKGLLSPFEYQLNALRPDEVDVEVMYCGICHSDLSMLDNEWRITEYPFVPGHEIIGKIKAKGEHVQHLKIGQTVGVGWLAGSCLSCGECMSGNHNLCAQRQQTIVNRYGGFGSQVRCQAAWAIPIPEGVDLPSAGPLLCGGITIFSPIIQNNVSPLHKVGVIGIGGLGHMALAFLNAWGCEVTAFSTSPEKEAEARQLGAHRFVSTHDEGALKKLRGQFDMILDTVNVSLPWDAYLKTLNNKGVFHIVGVASELKIRIGNLMSRQGSISASPTGSPHVMAQMLDFAARHQIKPMVESYKMENVNEALDYLRNGKPRYRIVLEP